MIRALVASLLAAAIPLAGCRSCGEDTPHGGDGAAAVSGPTMPTGMLVPADAVSAAASSASLRVARQVRGGAWAELQLARPGDRPDRRDFQRWRDDSTFVSLEAMTLLHEPFARALPGFDLFLPRLLADEALVRLAAELDVFALRSQGEIAATARELAAIARDAAAKGAGLWVLGM
jgi:hypothetical protein